MHHFEESVTFGRITKGVIVVFSFSPDGVCGMTLVAVAEAYACVGFDNAEKALIDQRLVFDFKCFEHITFDDGLLTQVVAIRG